MGTSQATLPISYVALWSGGSKLYLRWCLPVWKVAQGSCNESPGSPPPCNRGCPAPLGHFQHRRRGSHADDDPEAGWFAPYRIL